MLRISAFSFKFTVNTKINEQFISFSAGYSRYNKDEFLCSGATMQQQKLYDSLPVYCPKLKKLWISQLRLINISFVTSLKYIDTLILPS
jgi:hypothetical protein